MWLLVTIAVLLLLPVLSPLIKRMVQFRIRDLGRRRREQAREEARRETPPAGSAAEPGEEPVAGSAGVDAVDDPEPHPVGAPRAKGHRTTDDGKDAT